MPEQQLVEIARALGANAKVLIMDEPTASLSEEDTQNLFNVTRRLRARGVGIIYISHRLGELPLIADRVTVLRDGSTIDTRLMTEVDRHELIRLMVGRELSAVFPKQTVELGEVALELRHLGCRAAGVSNINLTVRAGEIVGLAGLVGAGRTELARTIFGLTPKDTGEILSRGKVVNITSPARAMACGIAYLPEDRRHHDAGLWLRRHPGIEGRRPPDRTGRRLLLQRLRRHLRADARRQVRREQTIAADYTARLGIKTPAIFAPVATLSGGNQQKVALSRWLAIKPSVLILDEPTQGIDVGAKSEIHALMTELAARGAAILMISSELPEILGMSDRIAVMRGGTIVGILDRQDATQQRILALALGHEHSDPDTQGQTVNS